MPWIPKLEISDYQLMFFLPGNIAVTCLIRNIKTDEQYLVIVTLPWEDIRRIEAFLSAKIDLSSRLREALIQGAMDQALIPHVYDELV